MANRDRTPCHRARRPKVTERAVTISFDVIIPSILGCAMWCLPLIYSRQNVDEYSRLWHITTCRLVRSHRRFWKNCSGFVLRTKQSNESFNSFFVACMDRDGVVGIATCYGLDGPGIECRWGARFSAPVQTGPGVHPSSYSMYIGSFPGIKRPGRGVNRPPPYSAEVVACTIFETLFRFFYTG